MRITYYGSGFMYHMARILTGTLIEVGAGYVPVLVTDCIGSRRESDREMAIRRAEQEGAVLTSSEAILFELLKEAGTPLSKEILKIVK